MLSVSLPLAFSCALSLYDRRGAEENKFSQTTILKKKVYDNLMKNCDRASNQYYIRCMKSGND